MGLSASACGATEGEAFSFGDRLDHIKREEKKALLAQLEQTTHCTRCPSEMTSFHPLMPPPRHLQSPAMSLRSCTPIG
jgi:hypothetical protein